MAHNILMCIPAFGQIITAATFLSTHAIAQALWARGIGMGVSTLSFPDIAELRAMFLTIFYDTQPNMSHLLMIDADMGISPDIIFDMIMFDEPVVGCIYPQRKLPISWAGSGTGQPVTARRGNFMQVEGVGMGCTLIRRDAVRIMLEKMPDLSDGRLQLHPARDTMLSAGATRLIRAFEKVDLPDRGVVSEDLSFCLRWNQCGGTVWACVGHHISHVGPFDFRGRYLDTVEQAMLQEAQAEAAAQALRKQQLQMKPVSITVAGGMSTPVHIEATPVAIAAE